MPRPLPVLTDVFRCVLRYTAAGQNAVNVMHIQSTSTATPSDIYTAFDAAWTTNQLAYAANTAHLNQIDITPLDGVTATQSFSLGGSKYVGGADVADYKPAEAVMVKLTTALRGRSHRGRLFLPFPARDATSDGIINPTTQGVMATAWGTFVSTLNGDSSPGPYNLVVASYKLPAATVVETLSIENEIGTQRRRQSRNRV